jgi:hypothetical protein
MSATEQSNEIPKSNTLTVINGGLEPPVSIEDFLQLTLQLWQDVSVMLLMPKPTRDSCWGALKSQQAGYAVLDSLSH